MTLRKTLCGRENGRKKLVEMHTEDFSFHALHLFGAPQREATGGESTLSAANVQDSVKQILTVSF